MNDMISTMEHKGSLLAQLRGRAMFSVIGVQLLLLLSPGLAQSPTEPPESGRELTDLTNATSLPLSTLTTEYRSPSSSPNSSAASASSSPSSTASFFSSSSSVQSTIGNLSSTQINNGTTPSQNASVTPKFPVSHLSPEAGGSNLSSTSRTLVDSNMTTSVSSSSTSMVSSTTSPFVASTSNYILPSQGSRHSSPVMVNHTTDEYNVTFTTASGSIETSTTAPPGEGIFTESFIRLLIIAGATAGSCLLLLVLVFVIVCCCHKRRQRRRNARYYEFKKKNYNARYERVEQKNSLARKGQPENTPIGGGWVFGGNDYHTGFDDGSTQNVALRSISPLSVATPILKVDSVDDPNGVPDSGHGGSIPPDDSAIGVSPSLEDDSEMEVNPLYVPLGGTMSIGTGSEARDHSYIGGDSDTISEGNEPAVAYPIRDVQFNSFGTGRRVTGEESVEL